MEPLAVLRLVTLTALGVGLLPLLMRAQHAAARAAISVDDISHARERFARALVFAAYWLALVAAALVDYVSRRPDQTAASVLTILAVLVCAVQLWIDHHGRSAP